MKRKIFFGIVILISIFMFYHFYFDSENIELYLNWHIYLPKANHLDTIYRFKFREGEDFSILTYSSKRFEKIISKKRFKPINQENLEIISNKVTEYYNILDERERELFDRNVNINQLLDINQNNLYLLQISPVEERTYIILLASISERKIYYLNAVW